MPLALALHYLVPAAVLGFLVVLYRASVGLTRPSRLSDAGLAASVLMMLALASNLTWTAMPHFYSGPGIFDAAWLYRTRWWAAGVLVPVAWLVFLVTFVKWPAPPLARASGRAAAWLGIVVCLAGLWPAFNFVEALASLWWDLPQRGLPAFYAWNRAIQGFLEVLRWILLGIFALAVWRMRPAADHPVASRLHPVGSVGS